MSHCKKLVVKLFIADLSTLDNNASKYSDEFIRYILENKLKYYGGYFKDSNGKPKCFKNEIFFNISHCNNMIIFGFSYDDIGIDIEKNRMLDMLSINFFLNADDFRHENPIQSWTIKEAFLKCLGIGLQVDPIETIIKNDCIFYKGKKYFYSSTELLNNYQLSIVMKTKFEIVSSVNISNEFLNYCFKKQGRVMN